MFQAPRRSPQLHRRHRPNLPVYFHSLAIADRHIKPVLAIEGLERISILRKPENSFSSLHLRHSFSLYIRSSSTLSFALGIHTLSRSSKMRSPSTILLLTTLLAPFVAAEIHTDAVCIDTKGGASVYNEAATKAACGNYKERNTGSNQWDTCPDCAMVRTFHERKSRGAKD